MKNHASVGEVPGPARDLTASPMSIFRTYPDLLQTRSLCLILRTYTISRVCMKSKIPFPLRKIFFEEELDRGGARKCRQKSSFWVEWPTRGLVLPMFSINFAEWAPPASSSRLKIIFFETKPEFLVSYKLGIWYTYAV